MFKIFEGGEFLPDFTKDIHYISWTPYAGSWGGYKLTGYTSMAWSYYITFSTLGISEMEAIRYFREIDAKSETGTFYPKANMTIMPNCRNYSDQEIYTHFNDALKCQHNLVRSMNVIFDMRNYTYHFPDTGKASNNEYVYMIKCAYLRNMYFMPLVNYFVLVSDIESVFFGRRFIDAPSVAGNIREIDELCLKTH